MSIIFLYGGAAIGWLALYHFFTLGGAEYVAWWFLP